MRIKALIMGLICLFIYVCATAPVPRQIKNTFTIGANFDDAWIAVIESFAELNLPIQNMEKDSGLIITDWIDFTGQKNTDYCDCGKPEFGLVEGNRSGKFNIFVKKTLNSSCEIKINCMYRQTLVKLNGDFYKNIACISTGKLESDLFNLIKSKLKL